MGRQLCRYSLAVIYILLFSLIRTLIQSCDPRNALNYMSTGDKLIALGAVANQEMFDRQEEGSDNRRAALMQGQNS